VNAALGQKTAIQLSVTSDAAKALSSESVGDASEQVLISVPVKCDARFYNARF